MFNKDSAMDRLAVKLKRQILGEMSIGWNCLHARWLEQMGSWFTLSWTGLQPCSKATFGKWLMFDIGLPGCWSRLGGCLACDR